MKRAGKECVRNRIIESAIKVFAKYGPRRATMEDIALLCGVSRVTIYNYFHDKNELIEEVVLYEYRKLRDEIKKVITSQVSPKEKIRAYLHTILRYSKKLSVFYNVSMQSISEYMPYVQKAFYKEIKDQEIKAIRNILDEGIEQGIFDIIDIDRFIELLLSLIRGINVFLLPDKNEDEIEDYANLFVNMVISHIKK